MTDDSGASRPEDGRIWRPPASGMGLGVDLAERDQAPGEDPRHRPPSVRSRQVPYMLFLASVLVAAIIGGVAGGLVTIGLDDPGGRVDTSPAEQGTSVAGLDVTTAVIEAVARARPAVVRVESATRRTFDVGSGVVISPEGYILTNAHVVMGTDDLKVVFDDGSERPAVLVGHDYPFNDIAVLQVAPVGLTVMEVADSSLLELGETVVAIGNPLGELYGSVSVGVISGLNRSRLLDGMRHDDIIQTDAAVNGGNSGGALINLLGQLVGIPTTILRQSASGQPVEGVAFAIPSNRAIEVASRIIASRGPIARPTLELEHTDLNEEIAARLPGLATDKGAVVLTVKQGGAAAAAGIRAGDVIVQLGETRIDALTPLLNALAIHSPGATVKVVLNRNGRIIETEVRLAQR